MDFFSPQLAMQTLIHPQDQNGFATWLKTGEYNVNTVLQNGITVGKRDVWQIQGSEAASQVRIVPATSPAETREPNVGFARYGAAPIG